MASRHVLPVVEQEDTTRFLQFPVPEKYALLRQQPDLPSNGTAAGLALIPPNRQVRCNHAVTRDNRRKRIRAKRLTYRTTGAAPHLPRHEHVGSHRTARNPGDRRVNSSPKCRHLHRGPAVDVGHSNCSHDFDGSGTVLPFATGSIRTFRSAEIPLFATKTRIVAKPRARLRATPLDRTMR